MTETGRSKVQPGDLDWLHRRISTEFQSVRLENHPHQDTNKSMNASL